ncbi:hypothetical protein ACFL0Y_04440 [Patescibacteria group bacterium]
MSSGEIRNGWSKRSVSFGYLDPGCEEVRVEEYNLTTNELVGVKMVPRKQFFKVDKKILARLEEDKRV